MKPFTTMRPPLHTIQICFQLVFEIASCLRDRKDKWQRHFLCFHLKEERATGQNKHWFQIKGKSSTIQNLNFKSKGTMKQTTVTNLKEISGISIPIKKEHRHHVFLEKDHKDKSNNFSRFLFNISHK